LPSASALEPEQPTSTNTLQPSVNPNGSVLGATIGPNNAYTSIVLNGGAVSMSGTQSGEVACETDSPGVCYSFAWLKGETVTLSVVPPAGNRLTSWGSSLCSPEQLTCALSLVDTDGYTLTLQFEPMPATLETPLPPSANTPTAASPPIAVALNQPEATVGTTSIPPAQTSEQPTLTDVAVNDIPYSGSSTPSIEDGKPVILSGTTTPGTMLKIYLEAKDSVTVVASQTGKWRLTIVAPAVGNHTVLAEVTNPLTKVTSPPMELVAFKVVASSGTRLGSASSGATGASLWRPLFVAGTIASGVFLLLAAATWLILRRHTHAPAPT
ncbi:hypothetical protein JNM87_03545, partial [Candidatus Saccharibacteria bacterium]|nr:hypothetical protein [Candidatus Saccharibacteria bacterium]